MHRKINEPFFIRRHLMHVLFCGFLNNRMKTQNLKAIFKFQNGQRFKQRYAGLTMAELIKAVWDFDICLCPKCGCPAMKKAPYNPYALLRQTFSRLQINTILHIFLKLS